MNTNDLYLEYARVIQMCNGTELEGTPWVCVRLDGETFRDDYGHPGLSASVEKYEFAVAVLEGRPVFVGDRLWLKDGHQFAVEDDLYINPESMSWTPPKRTFTLNGVELPCPVNHSNHELSIVYLRGSSAIATNLFSFGSECDARKVFDVLANTLESAERSD